MGVTITIGEWVKAAGTRVGYVPRLDEVDGPAIPGDRRTTNECFTSYTFWDDFCDATGVRSLFFDRNVGLFRKRPDIVRLDPHHAYALREVIARYKERRPLAQVHWEREPHLAQLHWLLHWFEWALANCTVPAIENS